MLHLECKGAQDVPAVPSVKEPQANTALGAQVSRGAEGTGVEIPPNSLTG